MSVFISPSSTHFSLALKSMLLETIIFSMGGTSSARGEI